MIITNMEHVYSLRYTYEVGALPKIILFFRDEVADGQDRNGSALAPTRRPTSPTRQLRRLSGGSQGSVGISAVVANIGVGGVGH